MLINTVHMVNIQATYRASDEGSAWHVIAHQARQTDEQFSLFIGTKTQAADYIERIMAAMAEGVTVFGR
jgi:hypothetical protein